MSRANVSTQQEKYVAFNTAYQTITHYHDKGNFLAASICFGSADDVRAVHGAHLHTVKFIDYITFPGQEHPCQLYMPGTGRATGYCPCFTGCPASSCNKMDCEFFNQYRDHGYLNGAWQAFLLEDVAPPVASAAPEPETYAMLLAGLGLLGFSARRRVRS